MSEGLSVAVLQGAPRRFRPYPKYKDSGVDWLGEIPAHWEIKRLKRVASVNPSKSEIRTAPPTLQVSFVPMEAVGEFGGLALTSTKELTEVSNGYTYFREGDLLVAKITPCFENGKGALARGLENGIGFGTTELHVLRPTQALEARFLAYVVFEDAFRKRGQAEMKGAAGQQRVPDDFVKDFAVPLPRLAEQLVIADCLDSETARIDTLVAKKERVIELLQEKRTALITQAVTKGLAPNAPMKDFGVEWLGEFPAHWSASRLKFVASRVVDCPHETPVYSDDGDYCVIRTADVGEGTLDLSNARRVTDEEYRKRIRRMSLEADDILYSREGERFGFAALVPSGLGACLGQRMMQFRLGAGASPRYVMWQLNSKATYQQAALDTSGATSPHVNVETIKNFWLAVPPRSEQDSIAKYIDHHSAAIDSLMAKIHAGIDRLKEFRGALISAAVTGKIDVREGAA